MKSPRRPDFVYGNGTFTTLDVPGATDGTFAYSINNSGQVAGQYYVNGSHGFIYSNGTFATIDFPGADYTETIHINDNGQVVGTYQKGAYQNHILSGFVYRNGTFTTLDVPGATGNYASSINDSGQVAGTYYDSSSGHGFIATPMAAAPTDIPTLSPWALLLLGLLLAGGTWRTQARRTPLCGSNRPPPR